MPTTLEDLTAHLLDRVGLVQESLGSSGAKPPRADDRFADLLDSMGMAELLAVLAGDCGATPETIEQAVDRRFGTVAEMACCLLATGVLPRSRADVPPSAGAVPGATGTTRVPAAACWLAGASALLPDTVQEAATLNAALHRPPGWLEEHAGIRQRRIWADQDPLAAAAAAGRGALARADVAPEEVGALLVTGEAPPLLVGLAAALHHLLGLQPETVALEVGGACTGFLAAAWLGQGLLARMGTVLVIALEAPSRFLRVEPGPAGEAAALFGDGAAAVVLYGQRRGSEAVPFAAFAPSCHGSGGHLLRVELTGSGRIEVQMDGGALAVRAVRVMAQAVRDVAHRYDLPVAALRGVVAHGGNGRMPALLARQLDLPPERVWSETADCGNLGAASLPVAWAARQTPPTGPVAWVAVGAGLTWGAAMTGMPA